MIASRIARSMRHIVRHIFAFTAALGISHAAPLPAPSLLGVSTTNGAAGTSLSVPMQIVILLTLLTLLPAVVMSITPFLRIVIVLHFCGRRGTQSTSNQILIGLSMFLTILIMNPVASKFTIRAGSRWKEPAQLPTGFSMRARSLSRVSWGVRARKDIALFLDVTHSPAPPRRRTSI
jgi:flagellar biosynthetic protein FliP